MFKNQKYIFITLAFLLFLLFMHTFISDKKDHRSKVKQFVAQKRDIIEAVYGSGKIFSEEEQTICASSKGEIKEVLVEEGDEVKKGDLLLVIENKNIAQEIQLGKAKMLDARARLKKLKSGPGKSAILGAQSMKDKADTNFTRAQKRLKDQKELFAQGFASKKELDEAKTAHNIAQKEVEMAQENLKKVSAEPKEHELALAEAQVTQAENQYRQIKEKEENLIVKAPFSGMIIDLLVTKESLIKGMNKVSEGKRLITLANMNQMMVKGTIFESDVNKVSVGGEVSIPLKERKKEAKGKVIFISQKAQAMGNINKFEVRIALNKGDPFFKYGMNVDFKIIISKKKNVLAIPLEYILKIDDGYFVYLLKKGKLHKQSIEKGIDDNLYAEVLVGLSERDVVALELKRS
ncbi:efflux RND transporter periplasmic adaptor subunit [Candidatus Auribacterota bacterium]